jgi:uncharacterized protein Yka (UPF0111/DUF47 family)
MGGLMGGSLGMQELHTALQKCSMAEKLVDAKHGEVERLQKVVKQLEREIDEYKGQSQRLARKSTPARSP